LKLSAGAGIGVQQLVWLDHQVKDEPRKAESMDLVCQHEFGIDISDG
jgi:hypothetical protein